MDVLASVLSDQLSCWLHHRVYREWQINYRNEARLPFLSWRAAVCLPAPPFLAMVPECVLFYIYSHFLLSNPYKCTQEKDVLRKGKVKNGAFIESKISQKHSPSNSKGTRLSRVSSYFTAFRPFHSKSTNTSIFQVRCGPVMMLLVKNASSAERIWQKRCS